MDIQFDLLLLGSKYLATRNISLTSMTWQQFSRSSQMVFLICFLLFGFVFICSLLAHLTLFSFTLTVQVIHVYGCMYFLVLFIVLVLLFLYRKQANEVLLSRSRIRLITLFAAQCY